MGFTNSHYTVCTVRPWTYREYRDRVDAQQRWTEEYCRVQDACRCVPGACRCVFPGDDGPRLHAPKWWVSDPATGESVVNPAWVRWRLSPSSWRWPHEGKHPQIVQLRKDFPHLDPTQL